MGLALLIPAVLVLGCGDKKEAHLERFLDPAQAAKAQKPEALDAFAIPDKPEVADRILTMGFAEVAERLGAHRFQGKLHYEMTGAEDKVSLDEDDLIVLARNGDFKVKVDNGASQGYEFVYSGGKLYGRNRFDPYHERSLLHADHLKWRDAAYGGFAAVYRLFRGQLRFGKLGLVRHHGRDAVQFSVALAKTPPRLPGTPKPPEVPKGITQYVYPIEPTLSDLAGWRDQTRPVFADGSVWVDADQAAVLKVEFKGKLAFPAPKGQGDGEATLEITLRAQADGFGNPPSIAPPGVDEVKPVPERILVDTHPLDFFFGKGFTSTLGKPAGVAARIEEEKTANKNQDQPKGPTGGAPSNP